jgi:hypothetical protein
MTWRRGGMSLTVMVIALGVGSCNGGDSTGPKQGSFGIGNAGSFVTTGGAEITFIVDFITNRMSFNAKGVPASGVFNFQGVIAGVDTHVHGEIICYAISADGTTARVAGRVTDSDTFAPGTELLWTVEDHGEGTVLDPAGRDRTTNMRAAGFVVEGVVFTSQVYCNGLPVVDVTFPTETGNVQVHL